MFLHVRPKKYLMQREPPLPPPSKQQDLRNSEAKGADASNRTSGMRTPTQYCQQKQWQSAVGLGGSLLPSQYSEHPPYQLEPFPPAALPLPGANLKQRYLKAQPGPEDILGLLPWGMPSFGESKRRTKEAPLEPFGASPRLSWACKQLGFLQPTKKSSNTKNN